MPLARSRLSVKGENYVYGDPDTFAKNMDKLFIEEKMCDTRFLTGQKVHPIYAHKAIIASRCANLSPALLPNTGEVMQSARSSHIIKDVEPEIFRVAARFMYANRVSFESMTLLKDLINTDNDNITCLTPAAMVTMLRSDDVPVHELILFQVAVEWAESYMASEGARQMGISKGRFSQIQPRGTSLLDPFTRHSSGTLRSPTPTASSTYMRTMRKRTTHARRSVHSVMSAIRYALLTPNELHGIEANMGWKQLIPIGCLADAWRIITYKQSGAHADERLNLPTTLPRRRGGTIRKRDSQNVQLAT